MKLQNLNESFSKYGITEDIDNYEEELQESCSTSEEKEVIEE